MARPMQPVMQRTGDCATQRAADGRAPSENRSGRGAAVTFAIAAPGLGCGLGLSLARVSQQLHDFFRGTRVPEDSELPADSDLRVEWIEGKIPGRAVTASALWHVAVVGMLLLPIWHFLASDPPNLAPVHIELTWTNPSPDLPPISLPGHEPKTQSKGRSRKTAPAEGRRRISSAANDSVTARPRYASAPNFDSAGRAASSAEDRSPSPQYSRVGGPRRP